MRETEDGKTVIGRYEPVVLTGPAGTVRVRAKADTAADRSNVGESVLEHIGRSDYTGTVTTWAGEGNTQRETQLVAVDLCHVETGRRLAEPNVKDRSGYTGNFLIGADLLTELGLVVDASVNNWEGTDDVEG